MDNPPTGHFRLTWPFARGELFRIASSRMKLEGWIAPACVAASAPARNALASTDGVGSYFGIPASFTGASMTYVILARASVQLCLHSLFSTRKFPAL